MTTFIEFAAFHGLRIDEPIDDGRIHRVPIVDDKPGKKSGGYIFHGARGLCWNWQMGGDAEYWNADTDDGLPVNPSDRKAPRRSRNKSDTSKVTWEQLEFDFKQGEKKRGT